MVAQPHQSDNDDRWGIGGLLDEEEGANPDAVSAIRQAMVNATSEDENQSSKLTGMPDPRGDALAQALAASSASASGKGGLVAPEVQATKARAAVAEIKPRRRKSKRMVLGKRRDNEKELIISPQILARHAAMLGSTGSGKTVMAKALIEEATLAGIPSLILDPQGDLARLALGIDEQDLRNQDGDLKRRAQLLDMGEVRIWTPLRSKGLPICIDPFVAPPDGLDAEEAITAWDMVAAGFTGLADYDVEKASGKQVKPYIYEIMVHGTRLGLPVGDFQSLSKAVREPHDIFTRLLYPECFYDVEEDEEKIDVPNWDEVMSEYHLPHFEDMLPRNTRNELGRRLAAYSSGVNQLLFSNGVPINFDTFCQPAERGKTPVNIVYLNTIQDDAQKQYFVQEIARGLYDWMLTQQPAEGELKLLFFMDEVAPYLPPYPRNPPAKDLVKLIFKQARKYGVACVLATQNVSDVDYKILAQANTTFIGRFTQPQDVEKVKHLLKEGGGDQSLVDQLPTLGPGQFQLVSPDVDPSPIPLQCRWLYTDHGAPLSEEQVEEITTDALREWSRSKGRGRKRRSGGGAAHAAAQGADADSDDGEGLVERARIKINGMAAAGQGRVDDAAFEVRLMGGLSVLKDGRDPLYLMQAMTNAASAFVLVWTLAAIMIGWRDSYIEWYWLGGGMLATSIVLGFVALEVALSHDAELIRKLSRFAKYSQIILVGWLWVLLFWSSRKDGLELGWAVWLLEVTVVWVTLFLLIEGINRIRLGRMHWVEGESALDTLKARIGGVSAMLTQAQFIEMRSNSKQILSGLRWCLDFITLLFLGAIFYIYLSTGGANGGAPSMDGMGAFTRPTLWIASIYALLFSSETWLRLRGRLPKPTLD
ncbi:MAG: DUF853 family protein [Candidatus Poseidoniaceae archaeon]|jgi:hypothetical protein|nr:DUF853 family protein [Candidatus Poseidoniaceae archaeon]